MTTTTATPAEIDARIAGLQQQIAAADMTVRNAQMQLDRPYVDRAALEATIDTGCRTIARLLGDVAPLDAEYTRRGGWTRYYLVPGGHVHTSRSCSTCFADTQFAWLTDFSGATEAEIVAEVGERACTVCMPTAPVHPQYSDGTSRMTVAEREAKQGEADDKAAKRAAKAAKQAADQLDEPVILDRHTTVTGLRQAGIELTDALWSVTAYGATADRHAAEGDAERVEHYRGVVADYARQADLLVAAIAGKTGRTEDDVRAEWTRKAAKRR